MDEYSSRPDYEPNNGYNPSTDRTFFYEIIQGYREKLEEVNQASENLRKLKETLKEEEKSGK